MAGSRAWFPRERERGVRIEPYPIRKRIPREIRNGSAAEIRDREEFVRAVLVAGEGGEFPRTVLLLLESGPNVEHHVGAAGFALRTEPKLASVCRLLLIVLRKVPHGDADIVVAEHVPERMGAEFL